MYNGKTVLITGASRGVGKHLAEYFISKYAKVIGISGSKEPDGINYRHYAVNLSMPHEISDVFTEIQKLTDVIDICINNAAVLTSQYSLKMAELDAWQMVHIDLLAPFLVARESARLMKDGGQIINISSMAVALEPMGDSMYAACKAGLNKMSNIIAKEFAGFGITVNTLAISAIETDMLKQLNKEKIDKVVAGLPIPRYATMDDITNVIDFFCSPKSSYITAQTIYLGGVHA
jgi:3-oxoacyl-[acyl-carrier protein] reductase